MLAATDDQVEQHRCSSSGDFIFILPIKKRRPVLKSFCGNKVFALMLNSFAKSLAKILGTAL